MKQDRMFGNATDAIYARGVGKLLAGYPGVTIYNGQGYSEGKILIGGGNTEFIRVDGNRYFVKYPTLQGIDKSYRIFTELFISYLAKKLGIDCIDCKLFVDNELQAIGVVSPDFGLHKFLGTMGIDYYWGKEVYVSELAMLISSYYPVRFDIDDKKLVQNLKILSCFDFLTMQADRHSYNVAMRAIKNGDRWNVTLAPMYDNAECLKIDKNICYKMVPTNGKYGESQAELMNTDEYYIKFYEKFKALTYGSNFDKTMREFENIYGLGKLFECAGKQDEYKQIVVGAKQCLRNQIEYCDIYGSQMH